MLRADSLVAILIVVLIAVVPRVVEAQPHAIDYNLSTRVVEQFPVAVDITGFQVVGDRVYLTGNRQLLVFDVADLPDIELLGCYESEFEMGSLAVANGVAFVSGWGDGLGVIDVSDPSSMVELSRVALPGWLLGLVQDYALVDSGSGRIDVVDVSDPTNPSIAAHFDYPGSLRISSFATDGDTACAALLYGRLLILDVSEPTSISLIGDYTEYYEGTTAGYVAMVGGYLYFCTPHDPDQSCWVWDLRDPATPQPIAQLQRIWFKSLVADGPGRFLSAGYGNIRVLDASEPLAPVQRGGVWIDDGNQHPVHRVGDHILAVNESGLVVVEEREYWGVPVLDELSFPDTKIASFSVHGDRAILALLDGRLAVVDVSNPQSMVLGSILELDNAGPFAVAAGDGFAVAVDEALGLQVLDWSDPDDVAVVGIHQPPHGLAYVAVTGNLAYAAAPDFGLYIYDLGDPAVPDLVGSWAIDQSLVPTVELLLVDDGLALVGYWYWSNWDYNYHHETYVLDLSDPTSPLEAAMLTGSHRYSVLDGRMLAAAGGPTVRLYSLIDPTNPELIGTPAYDFSPAFPVGFDGSNLYVSCGSANESYYVAVTDVTDPSSPVNIAESWAPRKPPHGQVADVLYLTHVSGFRSYPLHCDGIVSVDESDRGDTPPGPSNGGLTCFPNPFNPRLKVVYEAGVMGPVELAVYDVRGMRVATLHAGPTGTGRLEVVWTGCDDSGKPVPSGVYFVRSDTHERVMVRKVVLAR
jgi:hypothetical protein